MFIEIKTETKIPLPKTFFNETNFITDLDYVFLGPIFFKE
jgi:hypothetical protein